MWPKCGAPSGSPSVPARIPGAREGQRTDPLGLVLTLFWDKDDIDRR